MYADLCGLFNIVNVYNRGSDVIHRGLKPHKAQIVLDARTHCKERAGYVVAVGEVMLGDDWRGLLVVHVRVRVGFFELAQRFDAVIGNNNDVGVIIDVLQYRT